MANAGSCAIVRSSATIAARWSSRGSSRSAPPQTRNSGAPFGTNPPIPISISTSASAAVAARTIRARSSAERTPLWPSWRTTVACSRWRRVQLRRLPERERVRVDDGALGELDHLRDDAARAQEVEQPADEHEEREHGGDQQHEADGHGEARGVELSLGDDPQRHEREDRRGDEDAQRVLDHGVAPEAPTAAACTGSRELRDDDRDRDDQSRERDHPARHGRQHRAGRLGVELEREQIALVLDQWDRLRQCQRADDVEARHQDQAARNPLAREEARAPGT